jgi:hypothetical protein
MDMCVCVCVSFFVATAAAAAADSHRRADVVRSHHQSVFIVFHSLFVLKIRITTNCATEKTVQSVILCYI